MPLPVSLMAVVEALEMTSDERSCYINRKTGELASISEEERSYAEEEEEEEDDSNSSVPDWQLEMIEDAKRVLASDDFVELPDRFEIDEWEIMERFCKSVPDERIRDALDRSIRGRGAFRSFKNRVHEEGLADDWYRFRDQAFREIAAEFLTGQDIAFDPDKPPFEYGALQPEILAVGSGHRIRWLPALISPPVQDIFDALCELGIPAMFFTGRILKIAKAFEAQATDRA